MSAAHHVTHREIAERADLINHEEKDMNLATVKPSTIKQVTLKRRALAVVSAVGMAAVTLLQAMPASATEADGDPRVKCVQQDPYYFHGLPVVGATFDQAEPDPDRTRLSFQQILFSPLPSAASWTSGFTGELCGLMDVTLYSSWQVAGPGPGNPTTAVLLRVVGDGKPIGGTDFWPEPTGVLPLAQEFTFEVNGAVTDTLRITVFMNGRRSATFYYDHPDYAANFRISTLQPCDVHDPHPDCVEAGFDDLASDVTAFAETGEVTVDGETQLLAALDQAETAYGGGDGDNAEAVAQLEEFQRLASDPALVTTTAARDDLISAADTLIAAVGA